MMSDRDFGQELRTKRRVLKLSRQQLADSVGYTARSVKAWETGTRPIPRAVYTTLAATLYQQEEELRALRQAFRGVTPW
jgi:transcriptional regulator with XRE-family HTH domain